MKPAIALLTAGIALAAHGVLLADTTGRSLTDVRKQINSGTWPGITLIEAGPKAQAPAAGASAPVAPAASPPPAPVSPAANVSTPVTPAATTSAPTTTNAPATAAPAAAALAPAAPPASPSTPIAPVAGPLPSTAAPAPVSPAPATGAPSSTPSFGDRLRGLLGEPTGQSMQEAKRLDSPSIGIVLPTAGAASAPATPAR